MNQEVNETLTTNEVELDIQLILNIMIEFENKKYAEEMEKKKN